MMYRQYGEGGRRKEGWTEQNARSGRIHRSCRRRRPRDGADGRDRCPPPSPVTACLPDQIARVCSVDTVSQTGRCRWWQRKIASEVGDGSSIRKTTCCKSLTDGQTRAVTLSVRRLHATPKDAYKFVRKRQNQLNKYRCRDCLKRRPIAGSFDYAADVDAVETRCSCRLYTGAVLDRHNMPSAPTDWSALMWWTNHVLSVYHCV